LVSGSTAVTGARSRIAPLPRCPAPVLPAQARPGAAVSGATVRAGADSPRLPDVRRLLQLGLAALWLVDGLLQYQSFMFTRAFGQMLAEGAPGNPAFVAGPVAWSARIIEQHPVPANTAFATIQLLIGLGIACRPSLRAALTASVAWSVAVWWLGEGLGGIFSGTASPVNGAPGPVILYALLAVLLWPPREERAPGRWRAAACPAAARACWLLLWGSLAYFAVAGTNRAPRGLHDVLTGQARGEPGWLGATDRQAAALIGQHGLAVSVSLAVLLAVIAAGALLPPPLRRATIVLALLTSVLLWVVGQNLGGILAGGATDPDSGPLLMLIALAYWPGVLAKGRLS
jgi:hypothetical protein